MKKEYIIKLDFGGTNYYVRDNENGTWDEILDPHFATVFNQKKQAKDWAKENITFTEYVKVVQSEPEDKKFDEWVQKGMIRRSFNVINKEISRKYNNESPEDVLKQLILFQRTDENEYSYKDYATWPNLNSVFEFLFDTESYVSRKNDDDYHTFSIYVKPDSKYKNFEKEIQLIIPHITYFDSDGGKIISIFDRFLSAGGDSACLVANNDGTFSVKGAYFRPLEHKSLEECFGFIKKYRYYE